MKTLTPAFLLAIVLIPPAAAAPGHLATSFEANRGQFAPEVRFAHRSRDFDVRVLSNGAIRIAARGWTGTLAFDPVGVEMAKQIVGTDERAGRANVFVGATPAGWITGIPLFGGARS